MNKNDDQVIFIFEEVPQEVFTAIGEQAEQTMEEFSQFMKVEKPPEQTLEEFAEFMVS